MSADLVAIWRQELHIGSSSTLEGSRPQADQLPHALERPKAGQQPSAPRRMADVLLGPVVHVADRRDTIGEHQLHALCT